MEQEYVKIKPNKFLYYSFTNEYCDLLIKYNILERFSFSAQDIKNNNYTVYVVGDNYVLNLYTLPVSTWRLYTVKFNHYIPKNIYTFLLNNYVYEQNGHLYIFCNLTKELNNSLQKILHRKKHIDNIKFVLDYIGKYKLDTQQFIDTYHAVIKHPNWFYKLSETINYKNTDNLKKVQQGLITNINYISENCNSSCLTNEWWEFRGWNKQYIKKKIRKLQVDNSKKYRKKYNENPEKYKSSIITNIEYWLKKGYNYEEAQKIISKRQSTFSLDKCIEKYGESEGIKRFNERQNKWQRTLKKKPNYMEIVYKRTFNGICASKISQDLFINIHNNLKALNINIQDIYYQSNNHEWGFGIKNRGGVLYDFVIPSLKYAIEFNGERFHPNKNKLSEFDWNHWENPWGKSADYVYKKDKEKNKAITDKSFILDIIWESDYNLNKDKIINDCTKKIIKLYEESRVCKS